MKNLLFTILMAAPLLAYTQNQKSSNDKEELLAYSCRVLEETPDGKVIILRKDVNVTTENITLHADSAVISYDNRTWIVYGVKDMTFNREFVASLMDNNIAQYKFGNKTMYLVRNEKEWLFFQ